MGSDWVFPCENPKVHDSHYYLDMAARTWFCPGVDMRPPDVDFRRCGLDQSHLPHLSTDDQGAYWFCDGESSY